MRGAKGFWRLQGRSRAILCGAQRGFGGSRAPPRHSVRGAKGFWRCQCPSRTILCEAQSGFGDSRAPQVHSVRGAKGSRRFQGPSSVILCKARRGLSDSRGPPEPFCARRRGVWTTAAPRWADVCGMLWVFYAVGFLIVFLENQPF